MAFQKVITFLLAAVTVAHGCDVAKVGECMQIMATAKPETQCTDELPRFKACLMPYKEECKDDQTYQQAVIMQNSIDKTCSGCSLLQCQQTTPYMKGLPEGSLPEASEQFCASVAEQKMCVEKMKASCDPDDANLLQAKQMVGSLEMLCTGCSQSKMQACTVHVSSLIKEEFQGYPTSSQLDAACPKMADFNTCINPVLADCEKSEQGQQIAKIIRSGIQTVDVICGENHADFKKYAKECFEKPGYMNATKGCKMMDAPAAEGSNGPPKKETKEEMCSRVSEEFDCYTERTGSICSDDAVEFMKRIQNSLYNALAGAMDCPTSGSSQLAIQMWVALLLMLTAVFLF